MTFAPPQIADLDDRLRQTQSELSETGRQLQQQQGLAARQQLELEAAMARAEELTQVTTTIGALYLTLS